MLLADINNRYLDKTTKEEVKMNIFLQLQQLLNILSNYITNVILF